MLVSISLNQSEMKKSMKPRKVTNKHSYQGLPHLDLIFLKISFIIHGHISKSLFLFISIYNWIFKLTSIFYQAPFKKEKHISKLYYDYYKYLLRSIIFIYTVILTHYTDLESILRYKMKEIITERKSKGSSLIKALGIVALALLVLVSSQQQNVV
jgi:hypothetical protein